MFTVWGSCTEHCTEDNLLDLVVLLHLWHPSQILTICTFHTLGSLLKTKPPQHGRLPGSEVLFPKTFITMITQPVHFELIWEREILLQELSLSILCPVHTKRNIHKTCTTKRCIKYYGIEKGPFRQDNNIVYTPVRKLVLTRSADMTAAKSTVQVHKMPHPPTEICAIDSTFRLEWDTDSLLSFQSKKRLKLALS